MPYTEVSRKRFRTLSGSVPAVALGIVSFALPAITTASPTLSDTFKIPNARPGDTVQIFMMSNVVGGVVVNSAEILTPNVCTLRLRNTGAVDSTALNPTRFGYLVLRS